MKNNYALLKTTKCVDFISELYEYGHPTCWSPSANCDDNFYSCFEGLIIFYFSANFTNYNFSLTAIILSIIHNEVLALVSFWISFWEYWLKWMKVVFFN